MPVSPKTRRAEQPPIEEFILSVDGVAYRARRYAQVGSGGTVVCGYLLQKYEDQSKPYLVTCASCNCDQHKFRRVVCKHMEAVRKLEG